MLRVTAVRKAFGLRPVLRDASLSVERGEVVALTGDNGSGKTTLLRIVATLLRPDAGEVALDGFDAAADPHEVRARLGYLGHDPALYPELTGRENLRLWARLHRLPAPSAAAEAGLAQAGLEGVADDRAAVYSHGMLRRLALARALLHAPTLLLLDEPFSGLDARGTAALEAVLAAARENGRAVLYATHTRDAAAAADRAVHLAGGALT